MKILKVEENPPRVASVANNSGIEKLEALLELAERKEAALYKSGAGQTQRQRGHYWWEDL